MNNSSSSNDDSTNDTAPPAAAPSSAPSDKAAASYNGDLEDRDEVDALWNRALRTPLPTRIRTDPTPGSTPAATPPAPAPLDPSRAPSVDQLWSHATTRVPRSSERPSQQHRSSESSSSRRKREDPLPLLLALLGVLALLALVLFHPFARERAGGPWTVSGLAAGALFLIYLQPPVQQMFERMNRVKRRRERERRQREREMQLEEQRYLESHRRHPH